jgi:D-inositol-3-phosphate glycosyltransferase
LNKPAVETFPPAPTADPTSGSGAVLRGNGPRPRSEIRIGLLTGGDDKPYALGMVSALAAQSIAVDFIGSDKLDAPLLHESSFITFLNLRGDQREGAPLRAKALRILAYYLRLGEYAFRSRARIFHILWNNKFEHFDRTVLMFYYRLLGKRIVLTAHNVNTRRRDGCDSWFNRFTLRVQFRLCHHILVHTPAMRDELVTDFQIAPDRVTVIPFGINDTNPKTALDRAGARERLGLAPDDKVLLFFGQIAPYKGLEHLVSALSFLNGEDEKIRLLIAGRVKPGRENYWRKIEAEIKRLRLGERIIQNVRFIPDDEVEVFFKAADAVVIPYTEIFQSGVPFLSYSFGLPVIASDVGSLRNDIVEGETGFLSPPAAPPELARVVRAYFRSDLYRDLEQRRPAIREFAMQRYSWAKVAVITMAAYSQLLDGKTTMHSPVPRIVD